jgi:hypothetical protein
MTLEVVVPTSGGGVSCPWVFQELVRLARGIHLQKFRLFLPLLNMSTYC